MLENIICERQTDSERNRYAVSVKKDGTIIGQNDFFTFIREVEMDRENVI